MRFLFQNETCLIKIKVLDYVFVLDPWMGLRLGEGEKEIANHGRSRVKSFSQETVDKAQQRPRNGAHGQIKSQVQDARDSRTQLPFFFFLNGNVE